MNAMTPEQAVQHVTQNEPAFALSQTDIRGVTFTVFKNIPTSLPQLMHAAYEKQDNGAAPYIIYNDERMTYGGFCTDVNRLAQVLQTQFGLGKGDRVAIAMRNYPELLVLTMAIASIGAVTVFVNAWWTTPELEYALTDSGAKTVFADGPRLERLLTLVAPLDLRTIGVRDGETMGQHSYQGLRDSAPSSAPPQAQIDVDDDFAIMYSSGTTGQPKGVVQTHRGALNAVFSWLLQAVIAPLIDPPAPGAPETPRPSALIVTPLFHVTATHPLFLLSMPAGAQITLMDKWDAAHAVTLIRDEKITRFLGVPTQSAELMEAARRMGETLPTLDYLGAGGAKRPAAQVAQLAETFPNAAVATGWGMTETNALGIGMIGDEYLENPDATGKLHPPLQELRILDDAGNALPHGEIGEIAVKSPANMRCYLNKPEATAEVLENGWLRTGDLGRVDAAGFVTILDRKKNIIIRGGENIACLDVEGAIHRHPDVLEACAFSVPDERLGEAVGAVVQLREGSHLELPELSLFLANYLAKFKIPTQLWTQYDMLAKAATDKVDRRGLRAACLKTKDAT